MIDYDKHTDRHKHTDAYHQAQYELYTGPNYTPPIQIFKDPHKRHTLITLAKRYFFGRGGTEKAWQELEQTQVNPLTRPTRFNQPTQQQRENTFNAFLKRWG